MFEDIVLVHRNGEKNSASFAGADSTFWTTWKTCIRQIAVASEEIATTLRNQGPRGHHPFIKKTDEIFVGAEAYRFFLEVVCGLHSPIVGETEIMGQFKELAADAESLVKSGVATSSQVQVQKFFAAALADAKLIRATCLRDLGNRSYGSLLRRHVGGSDSLNIIGAGKLVREILPWLINKTPDTRIYCRRLEQGRRLKKVFRQIKVKRWSKDVEKNKIPGSWIIAAPLTAAEIVTTLQNAGAIQQVVDLRDSSNSDPVYFEGVKVLKLQEFFNQFVGTQKEVQSKAKLAGELIGDLVLKRFRTVEIRPFGWEDLCG